MKNPNKFNTSTAEAVEQHPMEVSYESNGDTPIVVVHDTNPDNLPLSYTVTHAEASHENAIDQAEAARNEAWGVDPTTFVNGNDYLANRPDVTPSASIDEAIFESNQEDGDVFSGKGLREIADIAHDAMIADDKSTAEEAKAVILDRMMKLVEEGKIDDDTAQSRLLYLESVYNGEVEASRSVDDEEAASQEVAAEDDQHEAEKNVNKDLERAQQHEKASAEAYRAASEVDEGDIDSLKAEAQSHVEAAAKAAQQAAKKADRPTAGEARDAARANGTLRDFDSVPYESSDVENEDAADDESEETKTPRKARKGFRKFLGNFRRAARVKRIQKRNEILAKANEIREADGREPLEKVPGRIARFFHDTSTPGMMDWKAAKKALNQKQPTERGKAALDNALPHRAAERKNASPESTPQTTLDGSATSPADTEPTVVVETKPADEEKAA